MESLNTSYEIIQPKNISKMVLGLIVYVIMIVYGIYFYFHPTGPLYLPKARIIIYVAPIAGLFGMVYSFINMLGSEQGFHFLFDGENIIFSDRKSKQIIRTIPLAKIEAINLDIVKEGSRIPRIKLYWQDSETKDLLFADDRMEISDIVNQTEGLMQFIVSLNSDIQIIPNKVEKV